jgi:hypothetical protein
VKLPRSIILKVQCGAIKGDATAFIGCCSIATVFNVETKAPMPYLSLHGPLSAQNPLLRQYFMDLRRNVKDRDSRLADHAL